MTEEKKEFNEFMDHISDEQKNTALKWLEKLRSETPDTPISDEEKKQAQEIMEMSDEEFFKMEVYRKGTCICVSTPRVEWMVLAGRLWLVDIENNDKILWGLS